MMKRLLLTLAACLSVFCIAQAQEVKIKGSDTMLPLIQSMIEMYATESAQSVIVRGGGSSTGFRDLKTQTCDIAMASRSMQDMEKQGFKKAGKPIKETVLAYDALSIVVHPSNPIKRLTKSQLARLFSGQVKNWKELGGKDIPVQLVIRDKNSGTHEFIRSFVMGGQPYAPNAQVEESNSGIIQSVSQNKGAIGYVGLAYVEYIVSTVAVSFDGKTYHQPTFKTAMEKKYPILRALYLYYDASSEHKVKAFRDFALSPRGQRIATHEGYIPAVF